MTQPGAEAAGAERRHERHHGARILGIERHGPAEGGEADAAGGARAAVHHDFADQLRRKVTRGVVTVGVVVAEGNPVEGDVVAAVIDAADGGVFGLAQAGAVGLDVGDAGREVRDRRVVGGGRDIVRNILERQNRLGLARVQFAVRLAHGSGPTPGRCSLRLLADGRPGHPRCCRVRRMRRKSPPRRRPRLNTEGDDGLGTYPANLVGRCVEWVAEMLRCGKGRSLSCRGWCGSMRGSGVSVRRREPSFVTLLCRTLIPFARIVFGCWGRVFLRHRIYEIISPFPPPAPGSFSYAWSSRRRQRPAGRGGGLGWHEARFHYRAKHAHALSTLPAGGVFSKSSLGLCQLDRGQWNRPGHRRSPANERRDGEQGVSPGHRSFEIGGDR